MKASGNGNGHSNGAATRKLLRHEIIEATQLFQALRSLTVSQSSGLPATVLSNETQLAQDLLDMARWDLCEAMTAYLEERNKTSVTKRTRDKTRALLQRFVHFLGEKRRLVHEGVGHHVVEEFIDTDAEPRVDTRSLAG